MKAFVLAAGLGTRLRPYTDRHPKCLVPIHGKPLLAIWIELLARHGVSEVLINTHHHADQVEAFVAAQRSRTSMGLTTVYEPVLLGSAGTLWENKAFVAGQNDFMIAYADNLTNLDCSRMVTFHRRIRRLGGLLTMGLIRSDNPGACGIAELDPEGRVVKFEEKPSQPKSDLANGGVYVAGTEILSRIGEKAVDRHGPLDLGYHILPEFIGKMFGYTIAPDYLKDVGTAEAYAQAVREWPCEANVKNEILPARPAGTLDTAADRPR